MIKWDKENECFVNDVTCQKYQRIVDIPIKDLFDLSKMGLKEYLEYLMGGKYNENDILCLLVTDLYMRILGESSYKVAEQWRNDSRSICEIAKERMQSKC